MEFTILLVLVGLIAAVAVAFRISHRRRTARNIYRHTLESALADGVLSPDEITEMERIRAEKQLTPAEVRMVGRTIYRNALRVALADQQLTPEEDEALARLQAQLGLTERDLGEDLEALARLRLLARVGRGQLPIVHSPIPLVPQEVCHWVVQATLAERIGLQRRSRADLAGLEMSISGSRPFSAAGTREALRPSEEILPVDIGMLVVTSRRVVFQGAKRTLAVPHARLDVLVLYADGVRIDEAGDHLSAYILVEDAEVTAAILLLAARRRREEIRPTRRGRSA